MLQTLGYLETKNLLSDPELFGSSGLHDLGSFWFPYLGRPQIWQDSTRVCAEADAVLVLLESLMAA